MKRKLTLTLPLLFTASLLKSRPNFMKSIRQTIQSFIKLSLLLALVGGGSAYAKSLLVYSPGNLTPSYGNAGYVGERDALLQAKFDSITAIHENLDNQTLANYDAVMIEIPPSDSTSQAVLNADISLLNTFVADNSKRLLLFGEQGTWATWNASITSLAAMTSSNTPAYADLATLRKGISSAAPVQFQSPGVSPVIIGGAEVFTSGEFTGADNDISSPERFSVLWGDNSNVLTVFDQSMFQQYGGFMTNYPNNKTYFTNIATWLAEDKIAPTLSSSSPANNAPAVAVNSNIVLNFSEAVDLESGSIYLHKKDDSPYLYIEEFKFTEGVDIGSGTNQITLNPSSDLLASTEYYVLIDAEAFDDPSGNSYAGISSTTALSFTTTEVINPTISSTTIATNNSTIAVTFSEAVYKATGGSGALEVGDFTLSLSGGTATLSSATPSSISISGNVYTLGLSLSGIANGSETITVVPSSSTAIYDGADNAASTTQSNNIVSLNSDRLPSPLNKKDVVASVEAWNGATSKWAGNVMDSISDRLNWLSRHKDTTQTSYQGIKIHFENEVIEAVMNATPRSKATIVADIKNIDVTNKANTLLQNTQGALVATGKGIQSDAQAIALNEAARFRNDIIGTLNPSFGTVVDDWSVWTSGEVSIGETKASATSSKQESNSKILSLGFDKKTNTNNLTGFVLSIGQDDIDIGTSTTNVKSDNYNLSSYGAFKQQNGTIVEAIFGLGHLKFDTIRKDGSDTLTGKRNANQLFASATLRDKTIKHNNWSISPYGKLTLAHTKLKKFSEAGGSTALTFNEQSVNDARVFVGADANYLITINNGTIKPFAKLEYGHDVSSSSDATMHYNTETTNYTLTVDKKAKSNWKMDVGADLFTKDGWNSSISYRREQAIDSGHSDGLSFDVGLRF